MLDFAGGGGVATSRGQRESTEKAIGEEGSGRPTRQSWLRGTEGWEGEGKWEVA